MIIHPCAPFAMQGRNADFAMQVWCPLQDVNAGDEADTSHLHFWPYVWIDGPTKQQHLLQAMARSMFSLLMAKLVRRLNLRQAVWCGCSVFYLTLIRLLAFRLIEPVAVCVERQGATLQPPEQKQVLPTGLDAPVLCRALALKGYQISGCSGSPVGPVVLAECSGHPLRLYRLCVLASLRAAVPDVPLKFGSGDA